MSDADAFGANPFRALNAKKFPEKQKNGSNERKPAHHGQGKGKRVIASAGTAQAVEVSDEDCDLFLNAVSSVTPAKNSRKAANPGFSLEERGAMTSMADALAEERGKGKKNATKAATQDVGKSKGVAPGAAQISSGHASPTQASSGKVPSGRVAATPVQEDEDDEASAFLAAMGTVSPLTGGGRDVVPAPAPVTPPPHGELSLQDFMDGKLEFALTFSDEYLEGHVVGLDQMILNKLRAGGLSPEAHLDLHGLNAMQAFEALRGFFKGSWYKGLRTVLVVPGRGRNSPDGMGVLREKLQSWLTQDPFKRVVLAFCTAQPHDGGPGSVYVLLRKYRKKGRIYWERMPADSDLY
ncbi:Smr/MutS family protein [Desulfovibrio desulfuricans]|uniref:Smr/MutS family protein n=1 Tax=Desulfovibrio desulfuricans TaxID=876 RepID=UPI0003B50F8E|nr:Smr/MutS family protein [Desulfovibrio desulfuricans]QTO41660.1 Smr/MutS family protein [Desulfovibrio desulfuricans]